MASTLSVIQETVIAASMIYHGLVGVLAIASTDWVRRIGSALYSLKLPETLDPRHEYTLKPLGAYALLLGALCARTILIPEDVSYRQFIVYCLAGTYALRALLRVVYHPLFLQAFGVPLKRSLWNVGFNLMLTVLLLLSLIGQIYAPLGLSLGSGMR